MMWFVATKRGFTFIEIFVVVAIIGIIATISAVSFQHMNASAARESGAQELFNAFNDARTKAQISAGDSMYGVRVSSTTITRFTGGTFVSGASGNKVYTFEGAIRATSTLFTAGGFTAVFTKRTGIPSVNGRIFIYDTNGLGTSTILLHKTGLVEYE